MSRITASEAIAHITSALVSPHDLAGTLSELIANCAELTSADACGLLVADGAAGLELLSATSHQVRELELYQAQISEGPCVEAWRTGLTVTECDEVAIVARWSTFGPSMAAAGFRSVLAQPMTWQSTPMGALNLFRSDGDPFENQDRLLARVFTDLAMVLIIHSDAPSVELSLKRASGSLSSRTVIEQAKGVLSHQHLIDMADAYDRLKTMAADAEVDLSGMARDIIRRAQSR